MILTTSLIAKDATLRRNAPLGNRLLSSKYFVGLDPEVYRKAAPIFEGVSSIASL